MSNETKQYAERDIESDELINFYEVHVSAMTSEGLHSKSAIAAELAFRDWRISTLEAPLAASEPRNNKLPDCAICVNSYHRADDGQFACDIYCVNGNRYQRMERVRLYCTVYCEDKTT